MGEQVTPVYAFGPFRLEVRQRRLSRDGEVLPVSPKGIDTLLLLAQRPWQTVSRDELMKLVWPNTFVEDSNLTVAISQLRKVLETTRDGTEYIQTVPRAGYRLVTDVRIEQTAAPPTAEEPRPLAPAPVRRPRWTIGVAAAVLAILAVAASFFYQRRGTPGAAPIKSLAVLPLYSLNGAGDDTAIRLGFADSMITSLGRVPEIRVLAASAIARYVDDRKEPVEIGRELGVDAVVSGTMHRTEGKFRVILRLLRTIDGSQVWSGTFVEAESEQFHMEHDIAQQAGQALALNLGRASNKPPTQNLEAYHLYLQGQYLLRRRASKASIPFFTQAIALDPRFARAWANLAAAYAMGDAMDEAQSTVNKALELEPDLAEAHAVRGFVKMFLDWDWAETEGSLNRAIALDPNSVEAHHWLGVYLGIRGRFPEGKASIERALQLDPVSDNMISDLGQIYYFAHEYEKAEALFKRADAIDPARHKPRLITLYETQGRDSEARELRLVHDCSLYEGREEATCLEKLRQTFARGGPRALAGEWLKTALHELATKPLPANQRAQYWAWVATSYQQLGHADKAAESLNRALETRDGFGSLNFYFPFVGVDPQLAELRDEPAFRELLKKLKLLP